MATSWTGRAGIGRRRTGYKCGADGVYQARARHAVVGVSVPVAYLRAALRDARKITRRLHAATRGHVELGAATVRRGVYGRFLIFAQRVPQGAPIRLMGGPGYRALKRNTR